MSHLLTHENVVYSQAQVLVHVAGDGARVQHPADGGAAHHGAAGALAPLGGDAVRGGGRGRAVGQLECWEQ